MDCTLHRDLDDVGFCRSWAELLDADPQASAFQGPEWIRAWAGCRAEGQLVVRALHEDGELVGVVAEDHLAGGRVTLAGGRDVTDYRGPISRPERRRDVAAAWLAVLAAADDGAEAVEQVDLHGIATDTGWLDLLDEVGGDHGWRLVDRAVEDVCPRVDLTGDAPDAWMDRIDGRERHELRRKARKLARDLGGMQLAQVPADELAAGLDRFWELAVTSSGDKGDFFQDDAMRAFFGEAVAALGPSGTLRIDELLVGGLPAASMISVLHGREWGLYNSSFDEALTAFAPGTVLAAQVATAAAEAGHEVLDFLRGDEEYKYRFGAVDRPIEQARLVRA